MVEREQYNGIEIPTPATLKRYGLTVEAWKTILDSQGAVCGACSKVPRTRRLVIDHEHVRGWKGMPAEKRAQYVRGLLCWTCNHYTLARGATVDKLRGAADYLERYYRRHEDHALEEEVEREVDLVIQDGVIGTWSAL